MELLQKINIMIKNVKKITIFSFTCFSFVTGNMAHADLSPAQNQAVKSQLPGSTFPNKKRVRWGRRRLKLNLS
jgi:hypothetical protein